MIEGMIDAFLQQARWDMSWRGWDGYATLRTILLGLAADVAARQREADARICREVAVSYVRQRDLQGAAVADECSRSILGAPPAGGVK